MQSGFKKKSASDKRISDGASGHIESVHVVLIQHWFYDFILCFHPTNPKDKGAVKSQTEKETIKEPLRLSSFL